MAVCRRGPWRSIARRRGARAAGNVYCGQLGDELIGAEPVAVLDRRRRLSGRRSSDHSRLRDAKVRADPSPQRAPRRRDGARRRHRQRDAVLLAAEALPLDRPRPLARPAAPPLHAAPHPARRCASPALCEPQPRPGRRELRAPPRARPTRGRCRDGACGSTSDLPHRAQHAQPAVVAVPRTRARGAGRAADRSPLAARDAARGFRSHLCAQPSD